ncbi:MAG: HutD family protein [Lachnospiraceae bacterium]|nr:HutD family protein [Lachnospiraceae bacterium]
MFTKISQKDYVTTRWSGGITRQLYIYPKGSDYQKRDFQYRISSAVVEEEESDFTYLPGVTRYLTSLQGEMELTIGESTKETVDCNRVICFDGGDKVHCVGKAEDFNLMLKGVRGKMFRSGEENVLNVHSDKEYFLYFDDFSTFYVDNVENLLISPGECCHIQKEEAQISFCGKNVIIIEIEV